MPRKWLLVVEFDEDVGEGLSVQFVCFADC
jgi:hypothetical protein